MPLTQEEMLSAREALIKLKASINRLIAAAGDPRCQDYYQYVGEVDNQVRGLEKLLTR